MKSVILTTPRSGAHMLVDLLDQAGLSTGWFPDTAPDVVVIHGQQMHEVKPGTLPEHRVLLYRNDTLSQAVSWYIGSVAGNWTERKSIEVPFDEKGISRAAKRIILDTIMLRELVTVEVSYEELLADPQETVYRIWNERPQTKARTPKIGNALNQSFARRWLEAKLKNG